MTFDGPRAPRPDERDELISHVNLVMREEVGNDPTYAGDWSHVLDPANFENIRIIRTLDRIVSSTGIYWHDSQLGEVRLRVGGINGVSTDPDFRRQGLASRVLRSCITRMAELGCHVSLLSTGVPSWYRKLGWEYAGLRRTYHFDRGNWPLLPAAPQVHVREAAAADFETVARLHAERRLGAVRTAGVTQQIFSRSRAHTWIVEADGSPVGYLWGREAFRSHPAGIREYAGPAGPVLAALRQLFETWDDPAARTSTQRAEDRLAGRKPTLQAEVSAPAGGDAVSAALDELGILARQDYLDMVRIEDPAGLLAAYGVRDVKAVDRGETIDLTAGQARLSLPRTQAAKLFLGPERPAAFVLDRLPLPFHEWPADMV